MKSPGFGAGRSSEQFSGIAKFIEELPSLGPDVDLAPFLRDLTRTFNPYSRPSGPKRPSDPACPPARLPEQAPDNHPESPLNSLRATDGCPEFARLHLDEALPSAPAQVLDDKSRTIDVQASKPVVASRIKWKYPPRFHPEPFLVDPLLKAAFRDPNVLRLPKTSWPKLPKAKVRGTREQILLLAQVWDSVGALKIFREDELTDLNESVGLFCVPKDSEYDRLILNPVVVNSRMHTLSSYTKLLANGSQLCLLHVPPDSVARFSADDLAEFYYTVAVSDQRAKRNVIGMSFAASELAHLRAFSAQAHRGRCFIALACLAMGDSLAVEVAQAAHWEVLRTVAGCLLPGEVVAFRRTFPRSRFCEMLCVDDYVGIQLLTRSEAARSMPARDTEVFARSGAAYKQVHLQQRPSKCRRRLATGGDGDQGMVSAPRDRVLLLMLCTAELVRRGSSTPRLLGCLLGCWIHVALFRRPALCVLDSAFRDASRLPADQLIRLSRRARNELLGLSILGPLLQADLRVSWCSEIFCVDASPTGAGLCSASSTETAVKDLWRYTEQRGYYTKLEAPSSEAILGLGLESEVLRGPGSSAAPDFFPLPASLTEGFLFDCIEICRGAGAWSEAHRAVGLQVHDGGNFDGPRFLYLDLANDSVFRELLGLACRRVVRDWHCGPPCGLLDVLGARALGQKLDLGDLILPTPKFPYTTNLPVEWLSHAAF